VLLAGLPLQFDYHTLPYAPFPFLIDLSAVAQTLISVLIWFMICRSDVIWFDPSTLAQPVLVLASVRLYAPALNPPDCIVCTHTDATCTALSIETDSPCSAQQRVHPSVCLSNRDSSSKHHMPLSFNAVRRVALHWVRTADYTLLATNHHRLPPSLSKTVTNDQNPQGPTAWQRYTHACNNQAHKLSATHQSSSVPPGTSQPQ